MGSRECQQLGVAGPLPPRRSMVAGSARSGPAPVAGTPKRITFAVGDIVTDPRAKEQKYALLEANPTDAGFRVRWRFVVGDAWQDVAMGRDGDGYTQESQHELRRLYEKVDGAPKSPPGFAESKSSRKRAR